MTEFQSIETLFYDKTQITPLLKTYCKILIKGLELSESKTYIKTLLHFSQAYGFSTEMIIQLGISDIESTPSSQFVFRGNTAFTRLFFHYLENNTYKYINSTIEMSLKEMSQHPQMYYYTTDTNDEENENLLFENLDGIAETLKLIGNMMISNIHLLPENICLIIKELLLAVKKSDTTTNYERTFQTFKTIFFLRFLFPALTKAEKFISLNSKLNYKDVIDCLKSITKYGQILVNAKKQNDQLIEYIIHACGEFVNQMNELYEKFMEFKTPTLSTMIQGMSYNKQQAITNEMMTKIRPYFTQFQSELESTGNQRVFQTLFSTSKTSTKQIQKLELKPMTNKTESMYGFFSKRMVELLKQNEEYKKKIEELKRKNEQLKKRIDAINNIL